jgi:hypothetical protein
MRLLLIVVVVLAMGACAGRVSKPADVPPGTPYISWIIMHGDGDNPDREFACQSAPRNDCVVPASTPEAQVFSDVHVYYHGTGAETVYAGSLDIGFLRGAAASRGNKTSITVKKDQSITNQSTTGIVTNTPGTYALTIAFDATADAGRSQPIREQVRVVVR